MAPVSQEQNIFLNTTTLVSSNAAISPPSSLINAPAGIAQNTSSITQAETQSCLSKIWNLFLKFFNYCCCKRGFNARQQDIAADQAVLAQAQEALTRAQNALPPALKQAKESQKRANAAVTACKEELNQARTNTIELQSQHNRAAVKLNNAQYILSIAKIDNNISTLTTNHNKAQREKEAVSDYVNNNRQQATIASILASENRNSNYMSDMPSIIQDEVSDSLSTLMTERQLITINTNLASIGANDAQKNVFKILVKAFIDAQIANPLDNHALNSAASALNNFSTGNTTSSDQKRQLVQKIEKLPIHIAAFNAAIARAQIVADQKVTRAQTALDNALATGNCSELQRNIDQAQTEANQTQQALTQEETRKTQAQQALIQAEREAADAEQDLATARTSSEAIAAERAVAAATDDVDRAQAELNIWTTTQEASTD